MGAFRRILIANRGEIALRVMRACRQMGISPVAVYSEADRLSPHARLADEAVAIGPAAPRESYLHAGRIIEAARRTGAEAVHPGYGFLAENAEFAEACERAGLVFIGPRPEVIRRMGRKDQGRALAAAAGVPVVPEGVGFPLLIKASAGGGGRGMRIVGREAELAEALESARREAEAAFGDGSLLLERYIEGARHVEFQILGDYHGNLVHLFERDCSIQRRHQKIIEESPSPALDEELRARMAEAALSVGRALGYTSAGTVEFLLAPGGEFYFIEVNTRIQVEHPVTEMITGLDLVRLQIEVAEGRPLRLPTPRPEGHAIEARLYAEDPASGFLPSTGRIAVWSPPTGDADLRIESGVEEGLEVGIHYDPLLAKLIARGPDRETALRRLCGALRRLAVHGVSTNREFLLWVLEHPEFRAGRAHTGFLDQHPYEGGAGPGEDFLFAAIAALWLDRTQYAHRRLLPDVPSGFRNNPFRDPSLRLRVGSAVITLHWGRLSGDLYRVCAADRQAEVQVVSEGASRLTVAFDGLQRTFEFRESGQELFVHCPTASRAIHRLPRYPEPQTAPSHETANSPMPGQVLRILVREGQAVRAGDCLIVLEAMKMEQSIRTTIDGVVGAVLVEAGQVVAPGQKLVQIHREEDGAGYRAKEAE
ncbi:MAG: biotin/lipoyl-binding protein [Candidatus Solibacter usitatus]|nr:biotin/lipoyl-binding protein [Candidatus Solibacter usitatus]